MEKQKICIIGGGLAGITTAVCLSKLNVNIDLITNSNFNTKSNRTTAISQSNYEFLRKLEITKSQENFFWSCLNMKIYSLSKNKKLNEILGIQNKNKKILYMMNNSKLIESMVKNIKKNKLLNIKIKKISRIVSSGFLKSVKFRNIDNSRYNLIIDCTGADSSLYQNNNNEKSFEHYYNEISITTILKHNPIKNIIAKQIFLNDGVIAFLPISNIKTSVIWSISKGAFDKKNTKAIIKNYAENFVKNIKFISKLEYKELKLSLRKKYFSNRVLFFGDALHQIHPLAGQGFNMTLRDLYILERVLKNKINLGLDIGTNDVLTEFANEARPKNLIYSLGIDFTKNFFSFKTKPFPMIRNEIINRINKNTLLKEFFFNIADKGLRF